MGRRTILLATMTAGLLAVKLGLALDWEQDSGVLLGSIMELRKPDSLGAATQRI